jgi:hypothetical protein
MLPAVEAGGLLARPQPAVETSLQRIILKGLDVLRMWSDSPQNVAKL